MMTPRSYYAGIAVSALLFATTLRAQYAADAHDPGAPGTLEVASADYDFGDTAFTPPDLAAPVEVRARVYYPAQLERGPFPLVVFMHGRHVTCGTSAGAGAGWPCEPPDVPIPSYLGFEYIQKVLSTHGYIVISISANGVNAADGLTGDNGALARAQLIQHHLALWQGWNTQGGEPFGATFVGRVDLKRVGTMGHSRGGEAVVRHFLLNREQASPVEVGAVLPLAATNATRFVINQVPLGVILPYCDGDVTNLEGVHYYDDARYNVPGDGSRKHTFLVLAANHNFFNTVWTPGQFDIGSIDDTTRRDARLAGDVYCRSGSPFRLTDAEQRAVGVVYVTGFFRAYLGQERELLPMLTGLVPLPSAGPTRNVISSFHAPDDPAQRRDINRFASSESLTRNTLGGEVTLGSLPVALLCGGDASSEGQCLPDQGASRQPHTAPSPLSSRPGLSQLSLAWDGPNASLDNALPEGARNIEAFATLQFRASVNFADSRNPVGMPSDLTVVLTDGAGAHAEVSVSDYSSALYYPPGTPMGPPFIPVPKVVLSTVQVPVAAFKGIDRADVRSIALRFDRRQTGALLITDLALSNPTGAPAHETDDCKPAAPTRRGRGPHTKSLSGAETDARL